MTKHSTISQRALAAQLAPSSPHGEERSVATASNHITVSGITVKAIKQAVVPTLRQKDQPRIFTVLEKMRIGDPIPDPKTKTMMPPATLVRVRSLENGRVYDYVVPVILRGTWIKEYDGGTIDADGTMKIDTGTHEYVGKSFLVQKGIQPDGKRYREIEALEIDPNEIVFTPDTSPESQP
jgi:hypothetical protein